MRDFFLVYSHLIEITLINCTLALAQFLTLRSGMFALSIVGCEIIGGYTAALMVMKLGVPVYVGLLATALLTAVVGWLFSLSLGRLRGHFLGLATLGFTVVVNVIALNWESLTNGVMGLNGIPHAVQWWEILLFLVLVIWVSHVLTSGRWGRALTALRENEVSASGSGVNVVAFKQLIFTVSCVISGMAGGYYAFVSRALVPTEFDFARITDVLVMAILGGTPHWLGAILGASVLTTMPEWLRALAQYRLLVSGLVLLVVIIYVPGGLISLFLPLGGLVRHLWAHLRPKPKPGGVPAE